MSDGLLCLCTICVAGVHRVQKWALDSLEPVSDYGGGGNQWKSIQGPQSLIHLSNHLSALPSTHTAV